MTYTHKSLKEQFFAGISNPGDTITIVMQKGVICDSVLLQMHSAASTKKETFSVPNKLEAWRYLKSINDLAGRRVWVKTGNRKIPYEKSLPYMIRFPQK